MADNQIKFFRGNRPATLAGLDPNAIYFFEDMGEIYTGGKTYGMSEAQTVLLNERLEAIERDAGALESAVDVLANVIGDTEDYGKDSILGRLDTLEEELSDGLDVIDANSTAIENLTAYVGEIPETAESTTVVSYINEKVADALRQAGSETAASVAQALEAHAAENAKDFKAVNDELDAVGEIAQGVKNELDAFKAAAEIGDAAVDTLKEIQDYITSDGAAAEEMLAKIGLAQSAAEGAQDAAEKAQEAANEAQEEASAAGEAAAAAQAKAEKAEGDAATAAQAAADADAKAQAAQDAVDTLAATVDEKASQEDFDGLADRVTETERGIETIEGQISDLQGDSHEHENKDILDAISAEDIEAWNNAQTRAQAYAESLLVWNAIEATV